MRSATHNVSASAPTLTINTATVDVGMFRRSFYATASGGIGWGLPAAVGVALGDRAVERTVIATIGD